MAKYYLFPSGDNDEHILDLLSKAGVTPQSIDAISIAKQILHEMTIPNRGEGYAYISYIVTRGRVVRGELTKEVYPETAKEFRTKPSRVERVIRFAVKEVWERGLPPQFLPYFPATHERPSNLEFLKALRELVEQRIIESAAEQ